jgi:RNA polymerase sigma-70 factor (ECF subfamily)
MTTREERRLVDQILAGDRNAFETVLDAYESRVYRLALRYARNVPDAEDLTQEIFLAVYKGLAHFRGQSALGTWIYRVALNHCLEFRRKKRLETLPYEEELTLVSQDWRENPQEAADRQELSDKVEAAINCLSPVHRDVIVLHELQGLTYQEVAATLNVPVGTVKSRLSNALRRLRDLLGGYVCEGTTS